MPTPSGTEDAPALEAAVEKEATEEGPEIAVEDSIAAPNTTGRRGCMGNLKEDGERETAARRLGGGALGLSGTSAAEEEVHSSFSVAVAKVKKEHDMFDRQATPILPVMMEETVEERLQRLDLKMDKLSMQMTECLAGLRVLYFKRQRPMSRPPPMNDSLIPVPEQLNVKPECPPGSSARSSVGSQRSSMTVEGHEGANLANAFRFVEAFGPEPTMRMDSRMRLSASREVSKNTYEVAYGPTEVGESELERCSSKPSLTRDVSRSSQNSRQSISSWLAKRQRVQGSMSQKVWNFVENPDSTFSARIYSRFMPLFILMSVVLSLAHAIAPAFLSGTRMVSAEIIIESIFFVEIFIRFMVCPNRWMFFWSTYNHIDMLSVLPLILRTALNGGAGVSNDNRSWEYLVLIGFVPAVRLLKTWRRFQQIHLLTKAFKLAFEALPVMLFIYIVVFLFFTAAMFVAEERSNIETLGQAMWLTFCSMTSSMFGDLYPKSDAGRIITSALVLISTLYMAIPIGIIGSCFSEVWADRDRILLVERMRRVFKQNGFMARDIPDLFSHFDVDCSGLLSLDEFKSMATNLKLGLSEDRLLSLFTMFDDDGSGGIDEREFCRAIFPEAYSCLYGDNGMHCSNSFKTLRRASVSLFEKFVWHGGS